MVQSNSIPSFLLAVTAFALIPAGAAFGLSFHSGAFGSHQSSKTATDQGRIISVYEGDRTALQLTEVPQMRTSVFEDSDADNGRLTNEANSVAGLPEGLFKLTDPERIRKLEQLAGSPLVYRNLRRAFATSLSENPDQGIATGASALFLARTIDASPRDMVALMRTGILILASKGTRYLPQASALVGFAVQVSGPKAHQPIVSSLRYSMIGALPENLPDASVFDENDYKSHFPTSQDSDPDLDWENFPSVHNADMALVNAGILEAVGLNDLMWGDILAMRPHHRMGTELMMAASSGAQWFDTFGLMGVGSGPFWMNPNPFTQEVSDSPSIPETPPPPAAPTPPMVFPTPPPPAS